MTNAENPSKGKVFENRVKKNLEDKENTGTLKSYSLEIGLENKKSHSFDLGNDEYLIECKCYTWTSGNNVPSAKLSVLNEAMFYFLCSPDKYRKILIINHHKRKDGKSLGKYYIERYNHLIPSNVEIWEYDTEHEKMLKIKT